MYLVLYSQQTMRMFLLNIVNKTVWSFQRIVPFKRSLKLKNLLKTSICLEILFTVGTADGICCFPCRCMNTKQAYNHCTDIVTIQTQFVFNTCTKSCFKNLPTFWLNLCICPKMLSFYL